MAQETQLWKVYLKWFRWARYLKFMKILGEFIDVVHVS